MVVLGFESHFVSVLLVLRGAKGVLFMVRPAYLVIFLDFVVQGDLVVVYPSRIILS